MIYQQALSASKLASKDCNSDCPQRSLWL